jgi:hypothetical protein
VAIFRKRFLGALEVASALASDRVDSIEAAAKAERFFRANLRSMTKSFDGKRTLYRAQQSTDALHIVSST